MNIFKGKFEKRKQKRTFSEYGFEIKDFHVEEIGLVQYAQWLHPFEKPKKITKSNIDFYRMLTSEGGMIVDIGAHTGDTTVPMALAVGREGLVIGLEPNKYVYKVLEQNAKLNQEKTNIVPLCFAATEIDGVFEFHYSDASFCNGGFLSQISNKKHKHNFTLEVYGKNLQKYLLAEYEENLKKLNLIKIDAEGYDKEIIKSISQILESYKPNMMIECFKRLTKEERDELFDVVYKLGYELFYLKNFEEIGQFKAIKREDMLNEKHFEMLAVHKTKRISL